ncbi:MAG: hypothetical protein ACREJU_14515 [Nitrospiraceae bacterium]
MISRSFFVSRLFSSLPVSVLLSIFLPLVAAAAPYFEDGFIGLTQVELREKLGPPQAVRDRKAALRVFNYYSFSDWENYYKKLVSPQNGEDVYKYKRDGIDVRYSFSYLVDLNDTSESPTLYAHLVDIEFSPSVPLEKIPSLVPELRPPVEPTAPSFRSNIWILVFKGPPSSDARAIVKEQSRENLEWSLAYQFFSLQGLPEFLTTKALVDRVEISPQSVQMVRERQRLTHEPIMNPFSVEFAQRPAPPPTTKKIPVPKYAD